MKYHFLTRSVPFANLSESTFKERNNMLLGNCNLIYTVDFLDYILTYLMIFLLVNKGYFKFLCSDIIKHTCLHDSCLSWSYGGSLPHDWNITSKGRTISHPWDLVSPLLALWLPDSHIV